MRAALPWLAIVGLAIAVFVHYGNRLPQLKRLAVFSSSKETTSTESNDTDPTAGAVQGSDKVVSVAGPLERWMYGRKSEEPSDAVTAHKPSAHDLIAPSPVGSSGVILHKTFSVATVVNFPFEIPAHAAMPQLRGHYQSFTHQSGTQASDESTNVAFLLMNEEQYADLVNRRPADALFSVDPSHDQDINFSLPASQNQPARFYLVFRNIPSEGKKIVQADFTVAF